MRRLFSILGSLFFLVIAPGTVAGYVPWRISRWHFNDPLFGIPAIRFAGVLLILAGLPVLLDSFARFALQGLGTPAPVFPTQHLVVTGWAVRPRRSSPRSIWLSPGGFGMCEIPCMLQSCR